MANEDNIRTDKPSAEVRELFFGSVKQPVDFRRQWRGGFEPDIKWLKNPLEKGFAKEFCTGCGNKSEVTKEHIERIFEMIKKDPSEFKGSDSYLELNACDFCVWTAPDNLMISVAAGKLPK